MPSTAAVTTKHDSGTEIQGRPRGLVWSFVLIALICTALAAVEIAARSVVPRISRVEGRAAGEYAGIYHPPAQRPLVLFLGNSLLGEAIAFPDLRQSLVEHFDARRYFVDDTSYYDWYYGMRRIFAEGARPRTVVLMLSDLQLSMSRIRGDYSAYRLLRTADIPELARTLQLHPTEMAGLVVASQSAFYGLRGEIRKVLLGRLMPDLPRLMAMITKGRRGTPLDNATFYPIARDRLAKLRALCEANGAGLIMLVPPLLHEPGDEVLYGDRVLRAARESGVEILRPFPQGYFLPEHFRDGFHLNDTGRAMYTSRLTAELKQRIKPLIH